MVLEHLKEEFRGERGAEGWIKNLEENSPSIKDLKKKRNSLSHRRPIGTTPSQKDGFYVGEPSPEAKTAQEMLPNQLDEIKTIIGQCERLFR